MPNVGAKPSLPLQPLRFGFDSLLVGFGATTAVISACFASYMIATGPGDRSRSVDQTAGSAAFAVVDSVPRRVRGDADIMDFTPTGSVTEAGRPGTASRPAPEANEAARALQGFKVRDVFDGKALVEARNRLQIVQPGMVIEGAGKVISINREGLRWVVVTTGGAIGRRP